MIFQLHHLLSASTRRFPDKTAVVDEHGQLSYAELDDTSSRLAGLLVERGVTKGDRVGIHLRKSLEAVVSIFGILKAGGVYVPIDPYSPADRAAHIIADCALRHLITSERELTGLQLAWQRGGRHELEAIITVSPASSVVGSAMPEVIPWEALVRERPLKESPPGVDADLAYILYTSGSTGVPKGVMISHRAAFTFVNWTHHHFAMRNQDVVANHAPLHFDLSIFDVFTTIKAGGTVVLVPDHLSAFPVTLAQFIRERHISVWYSVPSALTLMLVRGNFARHAYPDLRLVLFAGEVFPMKYLRALAGATTARLCNLYGPTETNVCTFYEVRNLPPERTEPVPIGKAIDNYEVFAITEERRRIQPGEVGELYARGPGLMSGYWGDPEKTARVLVPNMLQPHFEEQVCRTGDMVSLDDEGNYIYLGRRDHMVKSRGYRIELGEIETVLHTHPGIIEAVVVPIPDEEVTNRLKAFVVVDDRNGLTGHGIQEYCYQRLPKYMVPEMVEFREELPKTSTGKVDRKLLV